MYRLHVIIKNIV